MTRAGAVSTSLAQGGLHLAVPCLQPYLWCSQTVTQGTVPERRVFMNHRVLSLFLACDVVLLVYSGFDQHALGGFAGKYDVQGHGSLWVENVVCLHLPKVSAE